MNAMREPNKNYVYSLEDLTSEELKEVYESTFEPSKRYKYLYYSHTFNRWHYSDIIDKETTNAKELFYTLENVAVDQAILNKEQYEKVKNIFGDTRKIRLDGFTRRYDWIISTKANIGSTNFNKITYEKFMELFGNKEESKGLAEETSVYDDILSLIEKGKQQGLKIVVTFEKL